MDTLDHRAPPPPKSIRLPGLSTDSPFKPITGDYSRIKSVRVYPPIGIARVGSARTEAWIGPEYQQLFPEPFSYKDAQGNIKKMACRFRVFGFDEHDQPLGEIRAHKAENDPVITWDVRLVNSKSAFWKFQNFSAIAGSDANGNALESNPAWKANGFRNPNILQDDGKLPSTPSERKSLIIDAHNSVSTKEITDKETPCKDLSGELTAFKEKHIRLGTLHLARDGSLVVCPADGTAKQYGTKEDPPAPLTDDFNTPGWYDTTSDGSIDVTVEFPGRPPLTSNKNGGWLLVGPPKYAPDLVQPTSIYDGIVNLFDGRETDFWKTPAEKTLADIRATGNKDKIALAEKELIPDPEFWTDVFPILRRPTELAFTNPDAFGGHGPGKDADFTSPSWISKLKNKTSPAAAEVRKHVFFRLRSPYPEIAKGQADLRWMPRLSGNGGRCTRGDPTTWASLTVHQYKIMEKWSQGHFAVNADLDGLYEEGISVLDVLRADYLTDARFRGSEIADQLKQNIKAPLIYGTGQPVYPGIEVSWSYLLFQTYEKDTPFRINRTNVHPGDLNRLLSCPWQSDFYLCRNHWWPACRPDSVVPQSEYERIMKLTEYPSGPKFPTMAPVPWERGLRPQHGDVFPDLELVSNVDMIHHWEKLGFVGRQNNPAGKDKHPVYIEQERAEFLPIAAPGLTPILKQEKLYDLVWDLMKFEFSTIPCYLYAAWSIKVPDGDYGPFQLASANGLNPKQQKNGGALRRAILNIVSEEMLHLSLSGNLLTALGKKDMIQLHHEDSLPQYPGQIVRHPTGWVLDLAPVSEKQLNAFIQVEAPSPRFSSATVGENASIAQSYGVVSATLENKTTADGKKIRYGDQQFQFRAGEVYSPRVHDTGGSVQITDLASAQQAIKTICEQGEGMLQDLTTSRYTDTLKQELSHYQRFKQALEDIKNGNVEIWNLPTNPGANRIVYPHELKAVDDLFNAVYRYLLRCIDILYRTSDEAKRKVFIWQGMFPAMTSILTGLAETLIHEKLPTGTQAAPTFSCYKFPDACCWADHIKNQLLPSVQFACVPFGSILERLNVVAIPIGNLVSLEQAAKEAIPDFTPLKSPRPLDYDDTTSVEKPTKDPHHQTPQKSVIHSGEHPTPQKFVGQSSGGEAVNFPALRKGCRRPHINK